MFCVVFGRFIKYYFVIYLLHTIFTAGIRIVLIKMGIVNSIVHTIIGCCIGITVPMLIGYILSKIKYGEIAIYPHRTVMKNRNWGIMR
jgi:hypothetical protein